MAQYAKEWGFKITHSSPVFPQSNGLVERTIQPVKNMLKAAAQTGVDPHMALLHLSNTPVTGVQCSPAQLMGHVLRTSLPLSKAVLRPAIPVRVQQGLAHRQRLQKEGYEKTGNAACTISGGRESVHGNSKRMKASNNSKSQTGTKVIRYNYTSRSLLPQEQKASQAGQSSQV